MSFASFIGVFCVFFGVFLVPDWTIGVFLVSFWTIEGVFLAYIFTGYSLISDRDSACDCFLMIWVFLKDCFSLIHWLGIC